MQTGRFHKTHSGTDSPLTSGTMGVSPVGVRNRRDACPTISLTGRMSGPPLGMTLVEVLVAMVILLVGIWAVAASFPKLFGVLALEEKRTEMSRLAERTVERLKTDPYALPLAIAGFPPPDAPYIHPDSVPDDPDVAMGAPNSRDDILWVNGESFVAAPDTLSVHVFNLGLAHSEATTVVYQLVPLAPGDVTLDANGNVDASGAPVLLDLVELSYAWWMDADSDSKVDPNEVHWVHGEVVAPDLDLSTPEVQAASVADEIIADNRCSAIGLLQLILGSCANQGEYELGPQNTQLLFRSYPSPTSEQTVTLRVYYQLLHYRNDRRNLIMMEDRAGAGVRSASLTQAAATDATLLSVSHAGIFNVGDHVWISSTTKDQYLGAISAIDANNSTITVTVALTDDYAIGDKVSAPTTINLVGTGIDSSQALPISDPPNAYVLAVDLNHPYHTYWQDNGIRVDDAGRGIITLELPVSVASHTFRFYYRTTDQDMITVQKAPSVFVEDAVAPPSGDEGYRTYSRIANNVLEFQPCVAGQTVAVDYTHNGGQLAVGEMHTINASDYTTTLNNPNVESIIAVRGMSLKVRAWWRTQSGRLMHQDVDTILGLRPIS